MKFIHCSDIHLDSKLNSLKGEKAKERKTELRLGFERLVDFACKNKVKAIIIAGDLFDSKNILPKTKSYITDVIESSNVDFLYLSGNHDEYNFFLDLSKTLSNIKILDENSVRYDDVVIRGFSPINENSYDRLNLSSLDTNIVVMHGQVDDYESGKGYVNVRKLAGKSIDYLALGHLHTFSTNKLDDRGIYVYSGCLEGRGFDELGDKGFALLDYENKKINYQFIKNSIRQLREVKVDITSLISLREIEQKVLFCVQDISKDDLIKVVLTGNYELETEKDLVHLEKVLSDKFFFVKIIDESTLKLDIDKIKGDISLKGEFIRLVLSSGMDKDKQEKVIAYGLKALSGEDLE